MPNLLRLKWLPEQLQKPIGGAIPKVTIQKPSPKLATIASQPATIHPTPWRPLSISSSKRRAQHPHQERPRALPLGQVPPSAAVALMVWAGVALRGWRPPYVRKGHRPAHARHRRQSRRLPAAEFPSRQRHQRCSSSPPVSCTGEDLGSLAHESIPGGDAAHSRPNHRRTTMTNVPSGARERLP